MCCKNNNLYKFVVISSILILVFLLITVIILAINNPVSKTQNILTAIAKEGDNTEVGNVNIKFSENKIVVGNAITHEEGSDEININETGFYQISYQLNGIEQAISTFNFNAILIVNNVPLLEETLNEESKMNEYMMLGLSKIAGGYIQGFKNTFNVNPIVRFCKPLEKLTKEGLVQIDENSNSTDFVIVTKENYKNYQEGGNE